MKKTKNQIKRIQQHETTPMVLKQCFTHAMIKEIIAIQEICFQDEERCQHKLFKDKVPQGITAHPAPEQHESLSKIIKPILNQHLTLPYSIDFAFHQNKFPYGVHTDSGYDPDELIYKQGIIPLDITPSENEVSTIIFTQKVYDSYGVALENIADVKDKDWYTRNSPRLDSHNIPLDQRYFTHLDLALNFKWQVGDMAIWDRAHLHCSSDFKLTQIQEKLGLMWITKIKAP